MVAVAVGDKVSVSGTVAELGTAPNTLTELTSATVQILTTGNPLPELVDIAFPVTAVSDLERYEGMRVRVPQTSDYREHEWVVPFGSAVELEQSGSALRLATSASAFSEWLAGSPFAGEVTTDRLLGLLYLSRDPVTVARSWACEQLEAEIATPAARLRLLAGRGEHYNSEKCETRSEHPQIMCVLGFTSGLKCHMSQNS